jgi:hypothetical protein
MNSADRQLREALRALNASYPAAPDRVEPALRAAYRVRHPRRRWAYFVPLAAAAGLTFALLPESPPDPLPPQGAPHAPALAYSIPPQPPARPAVPERRRTVEKAQTSRPVGTEEFVPLYPGSSALPLERAQVLRVDIPRSALAPAGFAVDPTRLHERVRADVLMSEDGLIRGIRLVR